MIYFQIIFRESLYTNDANMLKKLLEEMLEIRKKFLLVVQKL